jgi:hypothetical protein
MQLLTRLTQPEAEIGSSSMALARLRDDAASKASRATFARADACRRPVSLARTNQTASSAGPAAARDPVR